MNFLRTCHTYILCVCVYACVYVFMRGFMCMERGGMCEIEIYHEELAHMTVAVCKSHDLLLCN